MFLNYNKFSNNQTLASSQTNVLSSVFLDDITFFEEGN